MLIQLQYLWELDKNDIFSILTYSYCKKINVFKIDMDIDQTFTTWKKLYRYIIFFVGFVYYVTNI